MSPAVEAAPVGVGDVLAGKYQVERVLGVGGMGVVVAARHMTLGERVAIKFLLPSVLSREDVVTRFRREGQAAARLKSEHITRVHDVGQLESGAPFLVMEYLDGVDLGAKVRDEGPLAIEHAVDYVMQACEALAEAHSIGIVHRDLKPSNLFVVRRLDGSPSIKLIDFGISKIQLPDAEGALGEMTATAVMMGSPLYMAPEQMASARDVDARADIWSLGIILHTVLTGAPPFRASTVMGIYDQILAGAPPIRRERADVPEGLEAVISRCLKKDRSQRYDDVGELAEALAPFAPEGAKAAADRSKRILAAMRSRGSVPMPVDTPLQVVSVVPAAGKRLSVGDAAKLGTEPTAPGTTSPSLADVSGTSGPWDQRTEAPAARRSNLAKAAVLAGIVAVAAPASFFVLRSRTAPQASALPAPAASATVSAEAPPPSVSPGGPAASATATQTVSVTASASAAESASAPAPTLRPRAPAAPRTPSRPKSPDSLFETQK